MSEETYNHLYKAIEQLVDAKGYKSVYIGYFGGEPMLEYDEICNFSERIKSFAEGRNISFKASMTTNGYLLSSDRLERLSQVGVTTYQITVDGLKETHNKSRILINQGGTWDRIVQNLVDAKNSSSEFKIMIRANCTDEINNNADEFLDFMSNTFGGDLRFGFHFEAVKKLGGKNDDNLKLVESETDVVYKMTTIAKKMGLELMGNRNYINPFGLVCYAGKNDSFIFDCDGTVMKCTVCIDNSNNHIGKLSEAGMQIESHLISEWTSQNLKEKCNSCKVLALCYGRKCPAGDFLSEGHCKSLLDMYDNALKTLFIA